MEITCESIGLDKEELQDRVVNGIVDRILNEVYFNEYGEPSDSSATKLRTEFKDLAQNIIDAKIQAIADEHIIPNVHKFADNLILQETNKWGEKKGEPLTIKEYMTSRAEHYMQELVDHSGKAKSESNSYGWSGKQTRITHLVNNHLQYVIGTSVKNALNNINSEIAKGLAATVKTQLEHAAKKLYVKAEIQK